MRFSMQRVIAAAKAHPAHILAAFLFFILEMALLVWPVGWLEEDITNFLTGEGCWDMESLDGDFSCCQKFKPEYDNLASIGIVISGPGDLQGGNAVITISDTGNRTLFETTLPYEEAVINAYTDIEIEPSLMRDGRTYYLSVRMEADNKGRIPVLAACSSMEYPMTENIALKQEKRLQDAQLVTRYCYRNVISKTNFWGALFICAITAFGIVFASKNRKFRILMGAVLLAAIPWILGRRLELLSLNSQFLLPFAMKWNIGIMYLFELILLLCTQSFPASICVSNLVLVLLYSANYFVFSYRGVSLRFNDLTAAGTAAEVVGNYSLRPNSHMAMVWCISLFFLVYGVRTGVRWEMTGKLKTVVIRLTGFLFGVTLALVCGYQFLYTDIFQEVGFLNTHGIDLHMNYHFNGYLVASFMDIQHSRIEKPQGYSVEKVEELLGGSAESGEKLEEGTKPHIILIMNESFSDLRVLGNLQISEENLTFFNSLEENTIRGYVNASVLGGGTANSEFEVFTGCSMGLLPASYYAYQQCVVREMPSLISDMKKGGYTAYSMHPVRAGNWNRDRVYRYFGFDDSL